MEIFREQTDPTQLNAAREVPPLRGLASSFAVGLRV